MNQQLAASKKLPESGTEEGGNSLSDLDQEIAFLEDFNIRGRQLLDQRQAESVPSLHFLYSLSHTHSRTISSALRLQRNHEATLLRSDEEILLLLTVLQTQFSQNSALTREISDLKVIVLSIVFFHQKGSPC